MDNNCQIVANVLQELANCSNKLSMLAIGLRKHPEVIRALNTLEFHKYETGSTIEGYVDIELKDGRGLCWWIDIQWQELWRINSCIYLNDHDGQKTIHNFNERIVSEIDRCINEIQSATRELVEYDAMKLLDSK